MTDSNRSHIRESRPADFTIKICKYHQRIIEGEIEFAPTRENISFYGLASLLEAIQYTLDESGFPQATFALRTWDIQNPRERPGRIEEREVRQPEDTKSKVLASFMLHIQFRQNAGWQGKLTWIEGRRSIAFRSVLEMVGLLEQAVQHAESRTRATSQNGAARRASRWKARESVS